MGRLALVLSGGGARGAYEGGVIHYIRTGLPKAAAVNFDIISGSSAGAIELLSFLTFATGYLRELVDLGYEDAKRNRHRLIELLASDQP